MTAQTAIDAALCLSFGLLFLSVAQCLWTDHRTARALAESERRWWAARLRVDE